MARIVIHQRKGPYEVPKQEDTTWICGCGLTRTPPYCDDSHLVTKKERAGELVHYPENDARRAPVAVDPALLTQEPKEDAS